MLELILKLSSAPLSSVMQSSMLSPMGFLSFFDCIVFAGRRGSSVPLSNVLALRVYSVPVVVVFLSNLPVPLLFFSSSACFLLAAIMSSQPSSTVSLPCSVSYMLPNIDLALFNVVAVFCLGVTAVLPAQTLRMYSGVMSSKPRARNPLDRFSAACCGVMPSYT